MTKRDFFILLVKVFGLFSIVKILSSGIPVHVFFALMQIDMLNLIWLIIAIIVIIGLFVFLIFKTEKIVSLLRLDKGFDDDHIELGNFNAVNIVKLASILFGGYLILNNIPTFLSHTLFAFKGEIVGRTYEAMDKFKWAVSGINMIIGYLILTNYSFISKILSKKKKD